MADGGAVRRDEVEVEAADDLADEAVVEGEGAAGFGEGGKGDDSEAVVRALFDELIHDFLCGPEAGDAVGRFVSFHVGRCHGAGEVEGDHDVDAAGSGVDAGVLNLGARQCDGEGDGAENEEEGPQSACQRVGVLRPDADEADGGMVNGAG